MLETPRSRTMNQAFARAHAERSATFRRAFGWLFGASVRG
jgi:hypothetical protein